MDVNDVFCNFYFGSNIDTRRILFEKAFACSKYGKVVYILQEELNEIPQTTEDLTSFDRNYVKMISFLYMPNLISLADGISMLPNWQNVPSNIILEGLGEYSNKGTFQSICGIVALLLETARCCGKILNYPCTLYISSTIESIGEENCKTLMELYQKSENRNKPD